MRPKQCGSDDLIYAYRTSHSSSADLSPKASDWVSQQGGEDRASRDSGRLVPVAATARGRHWCSQQARPKAWVRGHVQVCGDVRGKRRSRSGVCSFRNLGPQVPAVTADRAADPVRSFGTFTRDLHELADWMQECGVRTVAMESTGVYWIPPYQILETRGFQVFLVNAQHVKNVPGRKSDVSDCQWIQYLHSVGLLKASFRPPDQICVIRSLWRHRESLVQMAAEHTSTCKRRSAR